MGMTMTQKILAAHTGLDAVEPGQLIEAQDLSGLDSAVNRAAAQLVQEGETVASLTSSNEGSAPLFDAVSDQMVRILREKGYDPQSMTVEEKLADPVVREIFETYYTKLMWHVIPEMFDRFGIERIMREYDMTTSAAELIDVRLMKRTYARMIWSETDTLTKLTGFEVSEIHDPAYDPENDWPALYYYYGYLGFGLCIQMFVQRINRVE